MLPVKLQETAPSDDAACAIVRALHPRAGYIEACERGAGWDVFVYVTEDRYGTEPSDMPGAHAQCAYRVEQETV